MSEEEYVGWLQSIRFVNPAGQLLPQPKALPKDESDDPENDRELEPEELQQ